MFGLDSLLSRATNMAAVASKMDLSKGNNVVEFKVEVSTMLGVLGALYTVLLGLATSILYLWWFRKPSLDSKAAMSKGLERQVSGANLAGYTSSSSCESPGKSISRELRSPTAGACLCLCRKCMFHVLCARMDG